MKAYKLMFAAAMVMLAACSKGQDTEIDNEPASGSDPVSTNTFTFTATAEGDGPADKAMLDMSGAKPKTYWENGDQIKVWSDADAAAGYIFSTAISSPAATADFTYTGNFPEGGKYVAVHPARGDDVSNLDIPLVTHAVVIPSTQSLEEGGINKDYLSAAAYTKGGNTLAFKNTTSLVKFQVGDNRVFSGTVQTSEGEQIAGTYSVTFDNDGIPAISTTNTARETITFKLADDSALTTGKDYYVAAAPVASLTDGITVTFKNNYNGSGTSYVAKTYDVASLERNKIYNIGNASSNEPVSKIELHFHFDDLDAFEVSQTQWPSTFPTLAADEIKNCTFTLNGQDFTFQLAAALNGGKQGPRFYPKDKNYPNGVQLVASQSFLGFPAIPGFKLVRVKIMNKRKTGENACICAERQNITDQTTIPEYQAGGDPKAVTANTDVIWELTGTQPGKVYWLYKIGQTNIIVNHFYLTYEKV